MHLDKTYLSYNFRVKNLKPGLFNKCSMNVFSAAPVVVQCCGISASSWDLRSG